MDLFHVIDEGAVILRINGTYTQNTILRRGSKIYAEVGKGSYVELMKGNGTSKPNISWLDVEGPNVTCIDRDPKWVQPAATKPLTKAKSKLKVVGQ
jgi:hypothetical protein